MQSVWTTWATSTYVQEGNFLSVIRRHVGCQCSYVVLSASHRDEFKGRVCRTESPAFPVDVADSLWTLGFRETSRRQICSNRIPRKQQSSLCTGHPCIAGQQFAELVKNCSDQDLIVANCHMGHIAQTHRAARIKWRLPRATIQKAIFACLWSLLAESCFASFRIQQVSQYIYSDRELLLDR